MSVYGACALPKCVFPPSSRPYCLLAELQELLPGIINQLGPDNLANLKKIAEQYSKKEEAGGDEDVPELVDNFEEASQK